VNSDTYGVVDTQSLVYKTSVSLLKTRPLLVYVNMFIFSKGAS